MEQEPTIIGEAFVELKTVTRWVLSGLIEAFFVACWVITQWFMNTYVVKLFGIDEGDKTIFEIFRWLFGISTLAPIVYFLIKLLVTMTVRTWREIQKELKGVKS